MKIAKTKKETKETKVTNYKQQCIEQLTAIDPVRYAKTRNYIDGTITRLSPYITHGVITTKECMSHVLQDHTVKQAEKLLMEFLWKEFFMQVQRQKGNSILTDNIWEDKTGVQKLSLLPQQVRTGTTTIDWLDDIIHTMMQTGYLHNHKRMWLASMLSHWGKLQRQQCAAWTYFHFIDGELSANHLSWQRVASTFANKAYIMNKENIQKYRKPIKDKILEGSYESIAAMLFDDSRPSPFVQEKDESDQLVTPLNDVLMPWDEELLHKNNTSAHNVIHVLTPRKLDEAILEQQPAIIVLDTSFTKHHPWSQKRLEFIKKITDQYDVPFVYGSYQSIVTLYADAGYTVVLDERWDPFYREAQTVLTSNANTASSITMLPYPLVNTTLTKPVEKFFPYWNTSKKAIAALAINNN